MSYITDGSSTMMSNNSVCAALHFRLFAPTSPGREVEVIPRDNQISIVQRVDNLGFMGLAAEASVFLLFLGIQIPTICSWGIPPRSAITGLPIIHGEHLA